MKKRLALAAISGLLLAGAFPPVGLWPLAWLALIPLLFAVEGADMSKGFVTGLVFGFVFFVSTIYWVVNSMHYYGGIPAAVSVFVMLMLALYLSLYPALFSMFFAVTGDTGTVMRVIGGASFWAMSEFLRSYLFTGFPWILLGYSQVPFLPVIQIADITGVWGLSFLVAAFNIGLYLFVKALAHRERVVPLAALLIAAALVLSAVAYGFLSIRATDEAVKRWPAVRVGAAQGNIDQSVKWDASYRDSTLALYAGLTGDAAREGASIVVWPETAVPFYYEPDKAEGGVVGEAARLNRSYILTGAPSYNYNLETRAVDYFNSAFLVSPEGKTVGRYDKVHLVPYGEYVPLKGLFPFISKLTAGVGDFSEGKSLEPMRFDGGAIGTLICYEAIFPDISRRFAKNGANLLVNITNDAWFGRTSAPYQHFEMSVLRAVENRVYLVRSANTGISAVVDPTGRVLKRTTLFERTAFTNEARLRQGRGSVYTVFGDSFMYACMAFSALYMVWIFKRQRSGRLRDV